jgi:hypothetical protein
MTSVPVVYEPQIPARCGSTCGNAGSRGGVWVMMLLSRLAEASHRFVSAEGTRRKEITTVDKPVADAGT